MRRRADIGLEPGFDTPLDTPQMRLLGRRQVKLARKQAYNLIGTPAKIASSMTGRPSLVPGILMKPSCP